MFQTIFLAPVLFIESLMGCFILPKISKINPVYINAFSGSILSGVAVVSILPNIQSYYGRVSLLSSMFIMFCFQYLIKYRNTRKSVALLTNSLGLGFYSLLSGLSLSYVDGHDFIQFATLLVFSSLAISYSLGHRYIEYAITFKERSVLLLNCLAAPLGLIAGSYTGFRDLNSDIVLGASAGSFLLLGFSNLFSHNPTNALYLDNSNQITVNHKLVCLCTFVGFVIVCFLDSALFLNMIQNNTDLALNSTYSNSTNFTSTDFNSTDLALNSTSTDLNSTSTDLTALPYRIPCLSR